MDDSASSTKVSINLSSSETIRNLYFLKERKIFVLTADVENRGYLDTLKEIAEQKKDCGVKVFNTILLPHLGHFPTRGPERLVGICTPYRYKFPVGARDLFSFLEAVSSISNNLSPFPLVTCTFL